MDVLSYRPEPCEFAWTFGGVPPVRTVRPGDILELWTEDAFGGKVRGPDDHVTRVIEFPFVNPQTGPFFVEGAEPGDTLAIHFVSIEPSRDWAASCTVPLFGALTTTARTTLLTIRSRSTSGSMRSIGTRGRSPIGRPRGITSPCCPWIRCTGPSVSRRPRSRRVPRSFRTPTAGAWTRPRCARGSRATWRSTSRGPSSRSATGIAGRARVRPVAWRLRRRWTR